MADGSRSYALEDFELYQHARSFRRNIYRLLPRLPKQEMYALGSQMRRAAISVSNNIAEGHGRWHDQESIQFYRIARGSIEEIIDDLHICLDESYFPLTEIDPLKQEALQLIHRINSFVAYLKRKRTQRPN